jgi:hypothetical protein
MSTLPVQQYVCSGNVGQVSPAANDGDLGQNVSGCKAQYVAASGGWQITFDKPVLNPNNLDIVLTWNGANSSPDPPCFPVPGNVVTTGMLITFLTPTSTIPAHPNSLGVYFQVYYRGQR